jgi:hypothetical protein
MSWTEETKSDISWKCEDITDRTVTRKDFDDSETTKRGEIQKLLKDSPSTKVKRVDMENYWGSKNTISWTEESK